MFNISKRDGSLEINLVNEGIVPKEVAQFAEVSEVTIEGAFVQDVTHLSLLKNLNSLCFSNSKFKTLPTGLSELTNLTYIDFRLCTEMESINLGNLFRLERISLSDCFNLRELADLEKLIHMERLTVHFCRKIDFSQLNKLKNLKYFNFWGCGSINFAPLSDLVLNGCYFSAELDDWELIQPKLDLKPAIIGFFIDNDMQFGEGIRNDAANQILRDYFKKRSDKSIS